MTSPDERTRWQDAEPIDGSRAARFAFVCLAFGVFAFALVFAVGGLSTRTTQSFHGLHHSAYVVQIANGIVPPTNPLSLGMPANFYWAWHAALAGGVRAFGVTPFEMSLVSNALGLAFFLIATWIAAGVFTRDPWLRLAFCLLPFAILNPLGLTQFAARLALVLVPEMFSAMADGKPELFDHLIGIARHHDGLRVVDHNLVQLLPRMPGGEAPVLSDRAGNLINKFFNFNSFPVAVAAFAMGLAALVRPGLSRAGRAAMLAVAALVTALVSPMPCLALGIAVACFALARVVDVHGRRAESDHEPLREEMLDIAVPVAAAALGVAAALPLLLPIFSAYSGGVQIHLGTGTLWRHASFIGWALVPSLLIQLAAFGRFRHLDWRARGYLGTTAVLSLLAMLVSLPVQDPNEYKFVLLAAMPSCMLALALWSGWAAGREHEASGEPGGREAPPAARHVLTLAAGAGGLVALGVTCFVYAASPWAASNPFAYQGPHLELAELDSEPGRRDRAEALSWLREQTTVESYVLTAPVSKDALLLPVVAERRVVAALASPFTSTIAHHAALVERNREILSSLEACTLTAGQLDGLFSLPAPWPTSLYALAARSSAARSQACGEWLPPGVELVHANPSWAVYRIAREAP